MAAELPTFYLKRGCSSCDAARKWLAQHGVQVREREMFRQPLTVSEIENLIAERPLSDVLSTRTNQYAARGLNQRPHSEAELLRHMEAEPRLIRRPLIKSETLLLVGFDAARWAERHLFRSV